MRNTILKTTLAALVLSSPLAASEASAKIKDLKFHFVQGPYEDYPVYEMKFQSGKWKWVNKGKSFKPRAKYAFKVTGRASGDWSQVTLHIEGKYIDTSAKLKGKNQSALFTTKIGSDILKKKEAAARGACSAYGGSKKVIKDMGITGKLVAAHGGSGGANSSTARTATLIAKVVCLPKTATSGTSSNSSTKGPIIASLKLYSIPAKPKCGKPVTMVVDFQTFNQGKIDFLYHRDDGKKQKASVVSQKTGKYFTARWMKTYTFNKSTDRKYAVLVKKQNKSTQWVPLKVTCTKTSTGGKAS